MSSGMMQIRLPMIQPRHAWLQVSYAIGSPVNELRYDANTVTYDSAVTCVAAG